MFVCSLCGLRTSEQRVSICPNCGRPSQPETGFEPSESPWCEFCPDLITDYRPPPVWILLNVQAEALVRSSLKTVLGPLLGPTATIDPLVLTGPTPDGCERALLPLRTQTALYLYFGCFSRVMTCAFVPDTDFFRYRDKFASLPVQKYLDLCAAFYAFFAVAQRLDIAAYLLVGAKAAFAQPSAYPQRWLDCPTKASTQEKGARNVFARLNERVARILRVSGDGPPLNINWADYAKHVWETHNAWQSTVAPVQLARRVLT